MNQRHRARRGPWSLAMRKLARRKHNLLSVLTASDIDVGVWFGRNLRLPHLTGVVIDRSVVIGDDCQVMQLVTIGPLATGDAPKLGSRIDIGPSAARSRARTGPAPGRGERRRRPLEAVGLENEVTGRSTPGFPLKLEVYQTSGVAGGPTRQRSTDLRSRSQNVEAAGGWWYVPGATLLAVVPRGEAVSPPLTPGLPRSRCTMTGTSRRVFLGTSLGALTATRMVRASGSPAERVRLGVIGVRGRGTDLARGFAGSENAEVVAVCDIDDAAFPVVLKALEGAKAPTPRTEKDFRRLLDDKSIDAVVIATPDHWHAPMTVLACQAGKDVYCEKPASHNLVEGRRMVQAARKYDRIVQLGTQRRSAQHIMDAVEHLRGSGIGKVGLARAWIHQQRKPIGHGEPGEVPPGVDYALWQGPAPDRPFYPNRFHYNWHWFWNWGTGELGNNGIHGVDVARWGLGVEDPETVTSGGGKFVFDDDQEVPDTQVVTWEFPTCALVWEHRMWSKHGLEGGSAFGVAFYGDNGTLIIDEKGWRVEDGPTAGGPSTDAQGPHLANFLDCVRSRQRPNADIEIGHLSTRLCHLGNIAHRTGQKLRFNAGTESFPDQPGANALLSREYSSRYAMPDQV